jgi:IS5 family transposase
MQRSAGQLGFAEALVRGSSRKGADRLERIATLLDWSALEALLSPLRGAQTGRPGYRPGTLFRALLLQQWYGLSDPELEEALADRLSFRRFVGLALEESVPDETTLCRFRAALQRDGLAARAFAEINRQLDAHGLVLRRGTMIDATLVAASVRQARPTDGYFSPIDPEADWAARPNGATFGYKAHLAVDLGSGLVRKALLTPASVHDSIPADELVLGDEAAVYADRGYDKKARRAQLRARGVKDRIMHKAQRWYGLTRWQRRRNRLIAPIRSAVERTFGTLKRGYGYVRVRYRGVLRNQVHLHLLCSAFNLRKALALTA